MSCETICVKCRYHKKKSGMPTSWSSHLCKHKSVRNELVQDPVTGKWSYKGTSGEPWPLCREINKGNCELYEPQNALQRIFSSE